MKSKIFVVFLLILMMFAPITSYAQEQLETAVLDVNSVSLETTIHTGSYDKYGENWNWNNISPISDFIDPNNIYTIAYTDDKNVYISHTDDSLSITDTITIKKPMELVGGVCCDKNGTFYIACGQSDEKGKGGIVTFAIYQYDSNGKQIGKCEYKTTGDEWDTKIPFDAGNCVMTFKEDILICSYAREMYNGHQSNDVFCVNTSNMTESTYYDSYCSHSFNQAVITTSNGKVIFADHGDAYARGFQINFKSDSLMNGHYSMGIVPFHFYGNIGDNFTNARLTGIAELDTGIALVGSSAKSMKETFKNEKQQMFLQIIDSETNESIINASSRTGTSGDNSYTDTGILWLTNSTDNTEVRASAMAAIDKDKLIVMWEKWDKDNKFVNSYYSIISSDGKILKDSIPMQHARINGAEELKYQDGFVYWTYSEGKDKTAQIYRLNVNKTSNNILLDAIITLSSESVKYTGKAIKPSVTVTYNGKKLKKDTNYTVSFVDNKNIGIATVKITGKGKYSGTITKTFEIIPKSVTNFSAQLTKNKVKLSWKKVGQVTGYEIRIEKYAKSSSLKKDFKERYSYYAEKDVESGTMYYYICTDSDITYRTTTKTSLTYTQKGTEDRFVYCIRPYKTVNDIKIYGEWSDELYSWLLK